MTGEIEIKACNCENFNEVGHENGFFEHFSCDFMGFLEYCEKIAAEVTDQSSTEKRCGAACTLELYESSCGEHYQLFTATTYTRLKINRHQSMLNHIFSAMTSVTFLVFFGFIFWTIKKCLATRKAEKAGKIEAQELVSEVKKLREEVKEFKKESPSRDQNGKSFKKTGVITNGLELYELCV